MLKPETIDGAAPYAMPGLGVAQQSSAGEEIVEDRGRVYGDPLVHFPRVAQVWSGILNHEVSATDVALCLVGLKMVRTQETPDYSDNSDDIEGYLEIFRKLVGPDMIQARTTAEYVEAAARRNWGLKP